MNRNRKLSRHLRVAVRILLASVCGLAAVNCASTDYAHRAAERPVRVITEAAVQLTFINDHEFGDDVGDTVFVEDGDLQIYFNVNLPKLTARNMGVTIRAGASDTILVCAGSLTGIERPVAYRLSPQDPDAKRALDARTRVRICDQRTRR